MDEYFYAVSITSCYCVLHKTRNYPSAVVPACASFRVDKSNILIVCLVLSPGNSLSLSSLSVSSLFTVGECVYVCVCVGGGGGGVRGGVFCTMIFSVLGLLVSFTQTDSRLGEK